MKHVETTYTYKNKKLGYTIDMEKGGYSITMDSNDVFLMYKPYLSIIENTEAEYERLAIDHCKTIADRISNGEDMFIREQNDECQMMITNLLVRMYLTYFTSRKFLDTVDDIRPEETGIIKHNIEIILLYEVLLGKRHLSISSADNQYGIHEFFFPSVLYLVIEHNEHAIAKERITSFQRDIRDRCIHYRNDHDKELAMRKLTEIQQKVGE